MKRGKERRRRRGRNKTEGGIIREKERTGNWNEERNGRKRRVYKGRRKREKAVEGRATSTASAREIKGRRDKKRNEKEEKSSSSMARRSSVLQAAAA